MAETPKNETPQVFYKLENFVEDLDKVEKLKSEIDGVAIIMDTFQDLEQNSELLNKILSQASALEVKTLLVCNNCMNVSSELIDLIKNLSPSIFILPDLGLVSEISKGLSGTSIELGVKVGNPFPNFSIIRRHVKVVLMNHTLVKGRVAKDAKAKGVKIIAYLVNDPGVYLRMQSSGIFGVITENPSIVRESEKLRM